MAATEKSKANLKPFKKGDVRINRKGVPADTLAARAFIREIGAELLALPDTRDASGNVIPGEKMTRMKALIRSMFSSRAPADKAAILKGAYPGLLTDTVALTDPDGGALKMKAYVVISPDDWDKIKNGDNPTD